MPYYEEPIKMLVSLGLLDVVLPFIVIFAISYALLQSSKILGTEKGQPKANMNITISLVFSTFFVLTVNYVMFMQEFFTYLVIALFSITVFWLIYRTMSTSASDIKHLAQKAGLAVFAIICLIILGYKNIFPSDFLQNALPAFVVFGTLFAVMWFVLRSGKSESGSGGGKGKGKEGKSGEKNEEKGSGGKSEPEFLERIPFSDGTGKI
ncbi:MAG: hypothetical protein AABX39_00515 [Nanoarchaeota archaeon]